MSVLMWPVRVKLLPLKPAHSPVFYLMGVKNRLKVKLSFRLSGLKSVLLGLICHFGSVFLGAIALVFSEKIPT